MDTTSRVLVTGAGGFVGAHVVAALLRRGRDVRATASSRAAADNARAAVHRLVPDADLDMRVADLEHDEGWLEALSGCEAVVHVASPLPVQEPDDPLDLIVPARDGALRVVRAARFAGVRRVVMTSSIAAMSASGPAERVRYDETDWTDPNAAGVSPYAQSKTLAERAVREDIATNGGLELVTINPSVVLGPIARPRVNASVEIVHRAMTGKIPLIPRIGINVVDVRDVADLHVAAVEADDLGEGRFPASAGFVWAADMARILHDALGTDARRVPRLQAPDWLVKAAARLDGRLVPALPRLGKTTIIDATTTRAHFAWEPRPIPDTIVDCAKSLIEFDLV